jgi:predicted glycosyltransferase
MRVWYDACTGKHMRYGTAIARRLREAGHEVILTTREHPDTLALAKALGEKPIVVGRYDPSSFSSRLKESTKRMLEFAEMFKENPPDLAVAHQSVELCRTAFGLHVPTIVTADTPHAEAVNRLTIPIASTVLTSEAIPKRLFKEYGARKVVQFKGVDEVAWIKDFKPLKGFGLGHPFIVVRQIETDASYALGQDDVTLKIARKLSSFGKIVFLSRYVKEAIEGLTVMKEFVDSASLVAYADLVVSVGGTISREAALQGIPSIITSGFGRTYVNMYLAQRGFPLFIVDQSEVVANAKKILGKRFDVKAKLARLKNPVDAIERLVAERQVS